MAYFIVLVCIAAVIAAPFLFQSLSERRQRSVQERLDRFDRVDRITDPDTRKVAMQDLRAQVIAERRDRPGRA